MLTRRLLLTSGAAAVLAPMLGCGGEECATWLGDGTGPTCGEGVFSSGQEVMRGVAKPGEYLTGLLARLSDRLLTQEQREQVRGLLAWRVDVGGGAPERMVTDHAADGFTDHRFGGGETVVFRMVQFDLVVDAGAGTEGQDLETLFEERVPQAASAVNTGFVLVNGQPTVVTDPVGPYERLDLRSVVDDEALRTVPGNGTRVVCVDRGWFGETA